MDIIQKYSKTHGLQKQNYATVWKRKVLCYARMSCDDETYKQKLYKGIWKTTFKKRCTNHKKFSNAQKNKNDTKLSTEYWKLANKKLHSRIY